MRATLIGGLAVIACAACGGIGEEGANATTSDGACASGLRWTGGDEESPEMHPGADCIACHASGEGPRFLIAGTVFSALHETDDCLGTSGVTVELTGADQKVVQLTTNAAGNFYARTQTAIALPFTARVVDAQGRERRMATPQSSGDCASCHTSPGANSAPGRILAPQ